MSELDGILDDDGEDYVSQLKAELAEEVIPMLVPQDAKGLLPTDIRLELDGPLQRELARSARSARSERQRRERQSGGSVEPLRVTSFSIRQSGAQWEADFKCILSSREQFDDVKEALNSTGGLAIGTNSHFVPPVSVSVTSVPCELLAAQLEVSNDLLAQSTYVPTMEMVNRRMMEAMMEQVGQKVVIHADRGENSTRFSGRVWVGMPADRS